MNLSVRICASMLALASLFGIPWEPPAHAAAVAVADTYVLIGYNDLGMHCMNSDFSEIMVLPPFNTMRAQLIRRGSSPDVETSAGDFQIRYFLPNNTHSADKTNFWEYWQPLLGPQQPPNVGLTGARMSGTLDPYTGDWAVIGVPIVPIDDSGRENPYPLVTLEARRRDGGALVARTQAVMPVSTEITCNLCHDDPSVSTATDLLQDHDRLHGTDLINQRPVLCASCHASNALGLPGTPGLPSLSTAIHGAHAPRMDDVNLPEKCYACHPGIRTQCQRDVHFSNGITCTTCHGDMYAVGDPARIPWVDEPRCTDCHNRPGFTFEQPGVLYRDSVGHGNIRCAACHGSPHAIGPNVTEADNVQPNRLQGHAGKLDTCTVCHTTVPGAFFHSQDD